MRVVKVPKEHAVLTAEGRDGDIYTLIMANDMVRLRRRACGAVTELLFYKNELIDFARAIVMEFDSDE